MEAPWQTAADLRHLAQQMVSRAEAELARVRAEAARLVTTAEQIESAAGLTCQLQGFAADAAEYIRRQPGRTGEEISSHIGCAFDTFRGLVPKLKQTGITCRRFGGGGYFPPPASDV